MGGDQLKRLRVYISQVLTSRPVGKLKFEKEGHDQSQSRASSIFYSLTNLEALLVDHRELLQSVCTQLQAEKSAIENIAKERVNHAKKAFSSGHQKVSQTHTSSHEGAQTSFHSKQRPSAPI